MIKNIYSLVVINEDMDIVAISSYTNNDTAMKALKDDYEGTKEMLELDGWPEEDLSVDEFEDTHYWIKYGESSYYAEVVSSVLYDDTDLK